MDDIDRAIIQILQKNARSSLKGISNQVNLSVPAVGERIKKLENANYIDKYTALLNHKKINKNLTCFCMVVLMKRDLAFQQIFLSYVKNHPDILECHCVAGEQEYMLKIVTESMQTLEALLIYFRTELGVVRSSTYAVLSSIKQQPCVTY